jgi:hypothetical protein
MGFKENTFLIKEKTKEIQKELYIDDETIDMLLTIQEDDRIGLEKVIKINSAYNEMINIEEKVEKYLLSKKDHSTIAKKIILGVDVYNKGEKNILKNIYKTRTKALLKFISQRGHLYTFRKAVWNIIGNMYRDPNIKRNKRIQKDKYKELFQYFLDNFSYEDSMKIKGYKISENLFINKIKRG